MNALSVEAVATSGALLTAAVAALLVAERRESRLGVWLCKPVASTIFVGVAVHSGALGSAFGRLILLALVLSWLGDLLLIPGRQPSFVAGLASFLLAHLAFAGAFLLQPIDVTLMVAAALGMTVASAVILRWLWRTLPTSMRIPVVAYVLAISTMMALAVGTAAALGLALAIPAGLFVLSDVFVARERFVTPTVSNRLAGLPMYYAAQFLFAWQASGP